ncbi:hypothetical protein KCA1_0054 [Lactiplantibacillus pentosus KCA1]|nr:hypothetical protein KCA1_0054 [Lactiplantibacillus pentosus KCA1]
MKLSAFPQKSESENLLINFGPIVRVDGAPFGGFNDENVGTEGFLHLRDFLSHEVIVIQKLNDSLEA